MEVGPSLEYDILSSTYCSLQNNKSQIDSPNNEE